MELRFDRVDLFDQEQLRKLKKINSVLFSQRYNDFFYKKVITKKDSGWFYLLYLLDQNREELVGTFGCMIDLTGINISAKVKEAGSNIYCYVLTFGILAAYRRMGLGRTMWEYLEENIPANKYILHLQSDNSVALEFYKRLGFEQKGGIIRNYYEQLQHKDALLLVKYKE